MIVIGIDPGLHGGMAQIEELEERGVLDLIGLSEIPIIPARTKTTRDGKRKKIGRDQYNLPRICAILREWTSGVDSGFHVYVEQSIPLPPDLKAGSLAQFQRGVCRGWGWMLTALEIPHELVHPRTWMAEMHRGLPGKDTKTKSILAAQRLFPGVDLRRTDRCKVPHDGFAEALLIAEYGRRRLKGAEER